MASTHCGHAVGSGDRVIDVRSHPVSLDEDGVEDRWERQRCSFIFYTRPPTAGTKGGGTKRKGGDRGGRRFPPSVFPLTFLLSCSFPPFLPSVPRAVPVDFVQFRDTRDRTVRFRSRRVPWLGGFIFGSRDRTW